MTDPRDTDRLTDSIPLDSPDMDEEETPVPEDEDEGDDIEDPADGGDVAAEVSGAPFIDADLTEAEEPIGENGEEGGEGGHD